MCFLFCVPCYIVLIQFSYIYTPFYEIVYESVCLFEFGRVICVCCYLLNVCIVIFSMTN